MAFRTSLRLVVAAGVLASAAACASGNPRTPPPGTPKPDQYLFDKGMDAVKDKKWLVAREYLLSAAQNERRQGLRGPSLEWPQGLRQQD